MSNSWDWEDTDTDGHVGSGSLQPRKLKSRFKKTPGLSRSYIGGANEQSGFGLGSTTRHVSVTQSSATVSNNSSGQSLGFSRSTRGNKLWKRDRQRQLTAKHDNLSDDDDDDSDDANFSDTSPASGVSGILSPTSSGIGVTSPSSLNGAESSLNLNFVQTGSSTLGADENLLHSPFYRALFGRSVEQPVSQIIPPLTDGASVSTKGIASDELDEELERLSALQLSDEEVLSPIEISPFSPVKPGEEGDVETEDDEETFMLSNPIALESDSYWVPPATPTNEANSPPRGLSAVPGSSDGLQSLYSGKKHESKTGLRTPKLSMKKKKSLIAVGEGVGLSNVADLQASGKLERMPSTGESGVGTAFKAELSLGAFQKSFPDLSSIGSLSVTSAVASSPSSANISLLSGVTTSPVTTTLPSPLGLTPLLSLDSMTQRLDPLVTLKPTLSRGLSRSHSFDQNAAAEAAADAAAATAARTATHLKLVRRLFEELIGNQHAAELSAAASKRWDDPDSDSDAGDDGTEVVTLHDELKDLIEDLSIDFPAGEKAEARRKFLFEDKNPSAPIVKYGMIDFVWFHKQTLAHLRPLHQLGDNLSVCEGESGLMELQEKLFASSLETQLQTLLLPSFYEALMTSLPFEDDRFPSVRLELLKILYQCAPPIPQEEVQSTDGDSADDSSSALDNSETVKKTATLSDGKENRSGEIRRSIASGLELVSADRLQRVLHSFEVASQHEVDVNFIAKRGLLTLSAPNSTSNYREAAVDITLVDFSLVQHEKPPRTEERAPYRVADNDRGVLEAAKFLLKVEVKEAIYRLTDRLESRELMEKTRLIVSILTRTFENVFRGYGHRLGSGSELTENTKLLSQILEVSEALLFLDRLLLVEEELCDEKEEEEREERDSDEEDSTTEEAVSNPYFDSDSSLPHHMSAAIRKERENLTSTRRKFHHGSLLYVSWELIRFVHCHWKNTTNFAQSVAYIRLLEQSLMYYTLPFAPLVVAKESNVATTRLFGFLAPALHKSKELSSLGQAPTPAAVLAGVSSRHDWLGEHLSADATPSSSLAQKTAEHSKSRWLLRSVWAKIYRTLESAQLKVVLEVLSLCQNPRLLDAFFFGQLTTSSMELDRWSSEQPDAWALFRQDAEIRFSTFVSRIRELRETHWHPQVRFVAKNAVDVILLRLQDREALEDDDDEDY